ncbi:glycosyltransferase family 2 protein [Marinilabilia rubra]|uniref:Glycosyltransferase n=1 Tax=Marinilabilia rubra TaxID=2162893 RepID=A0A2U2B7G1_9BACT|nr:glycosyltransferase family 2 protein [Marinilabilia rubra]PWD98998.1 glycosyltransferase [Marinilabilia rubra]
MSKTDLPKVTIVTPSYNQADFLEDTIQSVLNQTYPNIEYIIVDGGSTDGSVDIIKKYEDKLAWWVSEPDNGQSDAINKGFKHATGDIYNWLNSDDILYPDAVKIAVHYMQKYPQNEVVYGDRIVIDGKGRIIDAFEPVSVNRTLAAFNFRIPQEATFFTGKLWKKVNGLNESLHFAMDADLWMRFMRETSFLHIPFFIAAYRDHEESKSVYGLGKTKSDKAIKEIKYLRKQYSSTLSRIRFFRRLSRYINLVRQAYERNKKKRRLMREEIRDLIANT